MGTIKEKTTIHPRPAKKQKQKKKKNNNNKKKKINK